MYDFGDEELLALQNLFKKNKLYRYNSDYSSECDLFEKEFSESFRINHSLILSSGTNALIAALLSLDIKKGDEIIVPIYTFFATINAVLAVQATPILVKNDHELGYDLNDLNHKITSNTKVIIAVHMDGLVSNIIEVKKICEQKNIFCIEDAAQALGADIDNKKVGTFGDIGCFSLNENKILTCGEGGIFVTNHRTFYEKAYCVHDTPSQFSPSRSGFYQNIKPFVGQSMRVSEIHGAIMRVQLKKLDSILFRLRRLKNIYQKYLSDYLIVGYSTKGECATTVHLKLGSVQKLALIAKDLTSQKIFTSPLIKRPAHVAWKWHHLINQTCSDSHYTILDFAESIDFLSSILRIELNIDQSLEDAETQAKLIQLTISNYI